MTEATTLAASPHWNASQEAVMFGAYDSADNSEIRRRQPQACQLHTVHENVFDIKGQAFRCCIPVLPKSPSSTKQASRGRTQFLCRKALPLAEQTLYIQPTAHSSESVQEALNN